jgi:hypothetical protein
MADSRQREALRQKETGFALGSNFRRGESNLLRLVFEDEALKAYVREFLRPSCYTGSNASKLAQLFSQFN